MILFNEIIFFCHSFIVALFSLGALRLGREALIAWICIQAALSNLLIAKQACILGFCVTCTDMFAVGCIFSLNLLAEYFGRKVAFKAVVVSFLMLLFIVVFTKIHLLYVPSGGDSVNDAFKIIFECMPRVMGASLVSYVLVQFFDVYFYTILKNSFLNRFILIRSIASLVFSQLLDTILFSFLGLWGLVVSIQDIILFSFLVKLIAVLFCAPFVVLAKRMMHPRNIEGTIVFESLQRIGTVSMKDSHCTQKEKLYADM
ncbi:MAG TPA: queuosine precursor transporter [Candidatus Babeliales bacterium]|nr:queuosine precursor transporter [Candidatus Babeliales bacterium]